MLSARGVALSDDQKARIMACKDLRTLQRCTEKAVTVHDVAELFAD